MNSPGPHLIRVWEVAYRLQIATGASSYGMDSTLFHLDLYGRSFLPVSAMSATILISGVGIVGKVRSFN